MKKTLIALIIVLFLGCHKVPQNWKQFNKLKNELNSELVNHFPREFKYRDAYGIVVPPSKGKYAIGIELILGLENINKIESTNLDSSMLVQPKDTCNLIINRFYYDASQNYISKEQDRLTKNCQEYLPIPNFAMVNSFLNENAESVTLPNDFEIYIIDAKKGKFLEDNELTDGIGLPDEWKNGYSKGIAYSEKRSTCIYWVIIW